MSTYLPPLPRMGSDGARGFAILAAVHAAHDLPELGNPYAVGLVDVPDPWGASLAAVTDDGDTLCERCVVDPANPLHPDDGSADGWGVVGWVTSRDTDGPDACGHCGREWTGHEEGDR